MSTDLTNLLALEAALEHMLKAQSGETLEYLSPTQSPPEDTQVHTTRRGARGYYPSEIGATKDEALGTTEGIREEVRRLAEVPEEEREIEVIAPEDPEDSGIAQTDAWGTRGQVNAQFENMYADLSDALGEHEPFLGSSIDLADLTSENLTKAGFTDGSDEGAPGDSGAGITSYANFTVEVAGKKFIFKASRERGDNRSEMLAYSVDRALNLNLVPYVQPHSIDTKQLEKAFNSTHPEAANLDPARFDDPNYDPYSEPQGLLWSEAPGIYGLSVLNDIEKNSLGAYATGHFQEFCENCLSKWESVPVIAEMLASKEGREEFLKLILLDSIAANPDRHTGNYMITEDRKILAIDNGFAGHHEHARPHDATAVIELNDINRSIDLDFPYGMGQYLANNITAQESEQIISGLEQEAIELFDKHFDEEALSNALGAVNWSVEGLDVERFKNLFTIQVKRLLVPAISGDTGRDYDSTPFFDWDSLPDISQPGDEDRHRDWKVADPVDDVEMGWGEDTPAHLQGGPRQGARR